MNFKKLDELVDSFYEKYHIAGSDLTVCREHEIIYRRQQGYSDVFKKIPMSGEECFYLFSCTKMSTCVATMQLIEQGKLSLDDEVRSFIPEFGNIQVKTENGTRPAKTQITVKMLMSMTSGMSYSLMDEAILDVKKNPDATTLDFVRAMAKMPLLFEPGTDYNYSLSHDVLGAIIELVSGMKFSEYLKKNIFAPLEMNNTGFRFADNRALSPVICYKDSEGYVDVEMKNEYIFNDNYESGGAGLISSPHDYIKLVDALANGGMGKTGNRILKGESVKLLGTPCISEKGQKTFDGMNKKGYSYGLGFRVLVTKEFGAKTPVGEFGWDGAAGCYYIIDTKNHIAVFWGEKMRGDTGYLFDEMQPLIRDTVYECLELD